MFQSVARLVRAISYFLFLQVLTEKLFVDR